MGRSRTPPRRKLAIATWRAPREPNIHAKLTVDVGEARGYLEHVRETTGERVTLTHLVGKAVALALAEEPTLNGRIRLGSYVPHDAVNVTFLVSTDGGSDLAPARVGDADRLTVLEIARDLGAQAERLRADGDPDWERSRRVVRLLPTWLLRPVVGLVGWLASSLGVDAPALGVHRFHFGSAIVTDVGVFGVDEAYVPPTPFARVPLYVLIGEVRDRPAVVDGEVVVRPELTVTATLDHRFVDGFQAATLARAFRRVLEDPWQLEDAAAGAVTPADGADTAAETDGAPSEQVAP